MCVCGPGSGAVSNEVRFCSNVHKIIYKTNYPTPGRNVVRLKRLRGAKS